MFHSFIKSGPGSLYALNLLIRGVIQQSMYETKIHDIDNLRKRLIETWFDFDQDITDSAIDQWLYHLRSCVQAGDGDFEHMFIYTVLQKKTGPFVISSYLCFGSYELRENFQKYIVGVACCEYGINVCDLLTIVC